jgi:hypothetical protein
MKAHFYRFIRDLHLYLGLFISPFVLLFSVTVFFFVHSWVPKFSSETSTTRVVSDLNLPTELQKLSGKPLVDALKPILRQLNVPGEIGFIRQSANDPQLVIPVSVPGRLTTVTIRLSNHEASITTRETGLADALMTLHKSPGQHGSVIRMNWFYMKVWQWFADATVYLTLFITLSGIYLWYMLRAERKIGFILLFAGTLTFFGLAYAVSH